jgi:hypothetical protein
VVAATAVGLVPGAVAPASAAPVAPAAPPTITGRGCAPGTGVTVVVDARELRDDVQVGCAAGQQASGFAALVAAGFTTNDDGGAPAGALCQIDGLPVEGYPTCWYEGYWSSWRSDGTAAWGFATTGPASGPLAVGTVEGWTWDAPGGGAAGAPRLTIEDLADHLAAPAECAAAPDLPTFDIVDDDEVLPVSLADGYPVEVAVLDAGADPATATWATAEVVALAGSSGPTRVLARRAGAECPNAPTFDAVYDVRATYAPRWSATGDGAPSPAIDKADPALVAFATGHADYSPGTSVNDSFKVPTNAYGSIDGSLVVLGDRGSITMTFEAPITDGEGADLAVFENGFAYGAGDYLELAYVEVSSDGEAFARFDSASRRAAPVGAFEAQLPGELGGLAGKDLAGKGTPFDLGVLRSDPAVRSGAVDLDRITHVRLQDIKGDGLDLDSFGRPIYDPDPVAGSAGFDLAGIGVLNVADVAAPVVTITAAPSGTVDVAAATVEFTVDDASATIEASIDGGPWAPATSPLLVDGLADGDHAVVVRATDAAGNRGEATASWTVALPVALDADASWAQAVATDLLGQAPTPAERAAVVARLQAGTPRAAVAGELVRSDAWIAAIVTDLYEATLGRAPDPAGLRYWTGQLASGRRTVAQAAASFYGSPEHLRRSGGTVEAWIADLYDEVLGRAPDASGLAYWVRRTAAIGRERVAASFYESPESRRTRVRTLYEHLLDRAPDPSGLAHWSARVQREGDLALAVSLVSSAEYGRRSVARFPSVPSGG